MLSYQWYSNASATNTGGTPIEGATDLSYSPSTETIGTSYYFAEVTNTNSIYSAQKATIRSNAFTLIVIPAQTPEITGPAGGTVEAGTAYELTVSAAVTDGGMLSYQWYSNTSSSVTGPLP
jgi:hypothetical protein